MEMKIPSSSFRCILFALIIIIAISICIWLKTTDVQILWTNRFRMAVKQTRLLEALDSDSEPAPDFGKLDTKPPLRMQDLEVDHNRLYYNRVPKCGSSTIVGLIRRLAVKNRYYFRHSTVFNMRRLNKSEQIKFVKSVKKSPAPCFFDRHLYFVDFEEFGERSPIYMNSIRDPVERIISGFYFARATAKYKAENHSAEWFNKDFEQCVKTKDEECTKRLEYYNQIPFLCGQDKECSKNSTVALMKAKQNIEKYYAVVGVLEHLNVSLRVLEFVLPKFLTGAYDIHHKIKLEANKNVRKKNVSEELKSFMRQKLGTEYEFYNFVVQRLHLQYKNIIKYNESETRN